MGWWVGWTQGIVFLRVAATVFQVVYVTAVVPYVVLIILLIWNAQLEGAWLGVKFYLIPKWSKLGTAKVRAHFCYFYLTALNSR